MQNAVTLLSLFLTVSLAILSLVTLHFVSRKTTRLGLIGLFTVLVASFLAFCGSRKTDVIIGTAGYVFPQLHLLHMLMNRSFTAVLVVFMSGDG